MSELNEPAISQAELDAAIERAEDAEEELKQLRRELDTAEKEVSDPKDEIEELEDKIEDLEDDDKKYPHKIALPQGGNIYYEFSGGSLQDTQIMEALAQAYFRIGATQLLSVLEAL